MGIINRILHNPKTIFTYSHLYTFSSPGKWWGHYRPIAGKVFPIEVMVLFHPCRTLFNNYERSSFSKSSRHSFSYYNYKLNTTDKVIAVLTGRSLFSPGVHFGEAETTLTASWTKLASMPLITLTLETDPSAFITNSIVTRPSAPYSLAASG